MRQKLVSAWEEGGRNDTAVRGMDAACVHSLETLFRTRE
jgi:hypothetical protein